VADLLGGGELSGWTRVESGGYSRASAHWQASAASGERVFVKHALTPAGAAALRKERILYEALRGSFMPAFLGAYDEGGTTLLVLEDLSGAEWPPPWSAGRIDAVLESLATLHASPVPGGLDVLADDRDDIAGWPAVASDPKPLLSTDICSATWLDQALPVLLRATEEAPLDGDDLLHFDVRSDNLCFRDGGAVLVDWNLAGRGNGRFDVAFWLPSLRLEGGPEPSEVLPDAGALAAVVAGFFAARAGLPVPTAAPTVRAFQRAQAVVALPWAARELGLPGPS
jgi:thiamine kinase-like enzyme